MFPAGAEQQRCLRAIRNGLTLGNKKSMQFAETHVGVIVTAVFLKIRFTAQPQQQAAGEKRAAAWKPPKPRYRRGVLAKYARLVSSASAGAVTDLPDS